MARGLPPLKYREVIDILRARGFTREHARPSHEYWGGEVGGRHRTVTVDTSFTEYAGDLLRFMIHQSGLSKKEFYGSTDQTARKIGLPGAML